MSDSSGKVAGVLICGGRSRRMGESKPFLELCGVPLMVWMLDILDSVTDRLILSAARGQSLPDIPPRLSHRITRVEDTEAERGPLQGILEGLKPAGDAGFHAAVVLGVDLPLMRPAMLRLMLERYRPGSDGVVPVHDGLLQPLAAVYGTHLIGPLAQWLDAGGRAAREFVEKRTSIQRLLPMDYETVDADGESFFNANSPAEYAEALTKLRSEPPPP